MIKLICILLVALAFEAVGVIFLKNGLGQIHAGESLTLAALPGLVMNGATNSKILAGIFFEALFFFCLLYLMSRGDISFVWPLTSLGFVIMTFAAKFYLKEEVSPARWLGVCLIMAGAALISWTENIKESHPVPPPAAERSVK